MHRPKEACSGTAPSEGFDINDVEVVMEQEEVPLIDTCKERPDVWKDIADPVLKLWWIHSWSSIPSAQVVLPGKAATLTPSQVRGWLFTNLPAMLNPRPGADVDLVTHIYERLCDSIKTNATTMMAFLLPHLGPVAKSFVLSLWKFVYMSIIEMTSHVSFAKVQDCPYNVVQLNSLLYPTKPIGAEENEQPITITRPRRPSPPIEMTTDIPMTMDSYIREYSSDIRAGVYDYVISTIRPIRSLHEPSIIDLQADAARLAANAKHEKLKVQEQFNANFRQSKRRSRSYRGTKAAVNKNFTE
eukprot:Ihof_evm5s89 gene=Ihof_evmTU5s89